MIEMTMPPTICQRFSLDGAIVESKHCPLNFCWSACTVIQDVSLAGQRLCWSTGHTTRGYIWRPVFPTFSFFEISQSKTCFITLVYKLKKKKVSYNSQILIIWHEDHCFSLILI